MTPQEMAGVTAHEALHWPFGSPHFQTTDGRRWRDGCQPPEDGSYPYLAPEDATTVFLRNAYGYTWGQAWNPVGDIADAVRLAQKLGLGIVFDPNSQSGDAFQPAVIHYGLNGNPAAYSVDGMAGMRESHESVGLAVTRLAVRILGYDPDGDLTADHWLRQRMPRLYAETPHGG